MGSFELLLFVLTLVWVEVLIALVNLIVYKSLTFEVGGKSEFWLASKVRSRTVGFQDLHDGVGPLMRTNFIRPHLATSDYSAGHWPLV
jgi:hypothetical protein